MGRDFKGVYHLLEDRFYLYSGDKHRVSEIETVDGLNTPGLEERFGRVYQQLRDEIELLQMAGTDFDREQYLAAKLTPVFFGAARSEEHTSELQSLMRISYAVFCLTKKSLKANTSYN